MKILLFLIIINFIFKCIKGDCTFNLNDLTDSPIFLQKLGNELLLLPITAEKLKFGDFTEIIAVCPSGFKDLQLKNIEQYDIYGNRYDNNYNNNYNNNYDVMPYIGDSTTMILKCINGFIKIKHGHSLKDFNNLNCLNSAKSEIYEISSTQNCNKNYYSVGLNIQEMPIIFADICYDLDNMRLNYIHYVATSMTPVLSHHVNGNFNLSTKAEAPAESFFIDEPSAHNLISNLIGNQVDFVTFKYEDLYPSDNLNPYIETPLEIVKPLNRFLGWTSFTQGNWKSFRNLLKTQSKKFTYDVYLGTSDVIVAPTSDECKSLKKLELEEFSKTVSVPKYVWAYLKSKVNPIDEFVVIGVNSPYFEFFPRNESIICDDICHEIDWFKPMEMFRKVSTFGYMFCCRKEQVQKRLDGFPLFDINTSINNEIEERKFLQMFNKGNGIEERKFLRSAIKVANKSNEN